MIDIKMFTANASIIKSEIIGNEMDFHAVVATLSDGRRATFRNAAFGQRDYPHVGTLCHVFDADLVDGGVVVFNAGDVELVARDGEMMIGRGGKIVSTHD